MLPGLTPAGLWLGLGSGGQLGGDSELLLVKTLLEEREWQRMAWCHHACPGAPDLCCSWNAGFHPAFPFGVPSMTLGGTALEADLQRLQLTWHFLPISLGSCLFFTLP